MKVREELRRALSSLPERFDSVEINVGILRDEKYVHGITLEYSIGGGRTIESIETCSEESAWEVARKASRFLRRKGYEVIDGFFRFSDYSEKSE